MLLENYVNFIIYVVVHLKELLVELLDNFKRVKDQETVRKHIGLVHGSVSKTT